MSIVASSILLTAAALNNDRARQQMTDTALIPYLNLAIADLREELQLNGITFSPFPIIIDGTESIPYDAGESYLEMKTAAYAASFIAENQSRAQELHGLAEISLNRVSGKFAKDNQTEPVRRRPFRATFKSRF